MKLTNTDEIKNGMVVFMPSGIQATLTVVDNKIKVNYPEMYYDLYTKEEFEKLIEEGIEVFSDQPTIAQQSVLMESVLNKLSKKGYLRESLVKLYKEDYEGSIFKELKNRKKEYLTADFKNELLTSLDRIAKEYPNAKVRQQVVTFMDELGLQEYYDTKAVKDFIKKHLDLLNTHVNESYEDDYEGPFHVMIYNDDDEDPQPETIDIEDEYDDALERAKYEYTHSDLEENTVVTVVNSNGETVWYIDKDCEEKLNESLKEDYTGKYEVFYDNYEGKYFVAIDTGMDYNEWRNDNEEIVYFNSEEEAQVTADELNDMIEDSEALDDDLDESLNEVSYDLVGRVGEKRFRNSLMTNGNVKCYNFERKQALDNINKEYTDQEILDGKANDEIDAINRKYEPKIKEWSDKALLADDKLNKYNKLRLKWLDNKLSKNKPVTEAVDTKISSDVLNDIATEIENGNKYGFEPTELGNWIVKIDPFDNRWEALTDKAQYLILEKIANSIRYGHLQFTDLELYINKDLDLSVEDIQSLQLFEDDEINNVFDDLDLSAYFSYELSFDGVLGESFKLKKKKKNKLDELGESIYLKDENGEEIGPFKDQEAEEQYIKDQKKNGNEGKFEEVIKEEAMKIKETFKIYNSIDPDNSEEVTFNSWEEVDNYLNQKWGEYSDNIRKENNEFGTEEDKQNYLNNFEVAILDNPIDCEVVNCDVEDDDTICDDTICDDKGDIECEECPDDECIDDECEEELEEELEEDFEEPTEEIEDDEEETVENAEEAKEKIDDIEDALDSIEDFVKTLLDDEEEAEGKEEEETSEDSEEEVIEKPIEEPIEEEFEDNMLTDINDLDFPDAVAQAVDTKEDGSLYKMSDFAKEIEGLKATIAQLKADLKSDISDLIQDLKTELKLSVNNVETKVQDTKSAVDNLTAEEEDIESLEEEPIEEEPAEEPEEGGEEVPEETEQEPEQTPESYEALLKGNKIYESIVNVMKKSKRPMSINTIAEKLQETIGINTRLDDVQGISNYNQISDIIQNTTLIEKVIDPMEEKRLMRDESLGAAKKWIKEGLMNKMEKVKKDLRNEALENIKKEIDKKVQQGADAEELKDVIDLSTDDEQEKEQAKNYAVDKLQTTAKVESLKNKLLNTSHNSRLSDMNIRG